MEFKLKRPFWKTHVLFITFIFAENPLLNEGEPTRQHLNIFIIMNNSFIGWLKPLKHVNLTDNEVQKHFLKVLAVNLLLVTFFYPVYVLMFD